MKKAYLSGGVCFAVAVLLQLFFDDVPRGFFAFPVNVALLLLWAVALWVLYREKRRSPVTVALLDIRTTFWTLGAFIFCCLIAGLSAHSVTTSWWFLTSLLALLTHLLMVIYRGVGLRRPHRMRFVMNHVGLFLLLAGGFFGSVDQHEWRVRAMDGEQVLEMYDMAGGSVTLKNALRIRRASAEYYPDGMPQSYEAVLAVDGREVTVSVNEPYSLSWCDDLYLVGYDRGREDEPASCVLQLVRQPWRRVQWAGIWMLLLGSVLIFVQGVGRKGGETI